jgi:plastocyanin
MRSALRAPHRHRVRLLSIALPLVLALTAVAACGGGESTPPAARVPVEDPVDPATAGRVTGMVTLSGTPPPAQTIKTASDPNCTGTVQSEEVVVGAGGALHNVFVYVKDGLGNLVFPVPSTPVVLAQKDCMYRPHVVGLQVGQTLDILNEDDTLHNIHAVPERNGEFNKAQQFKGFRNPHVFSTTEVMIPFKCDVHRWMSAYVSVLDHPFFAVTADGGTFALEGLPPGTYTIEAVHEKYGRQTQSVTLPEKGAQEIAFTFKT